MFAWLKDFFGQDVFTGDASCPGLEETGDINPATGLPMVPCSDRDVGGNPRGFDVGSLEAETEGFASPSTAHVSWLDAGANLLDDL